MHNSVNIPDRFLRLPEVISIVGISKTQIYEKARHGQFPSPYRVGANTSVWKLSEIQKWMDQFKAFAEKNGTNEG